MLEADGLLLVPIFGLLFVRVSYRQPLQVVYVRLGLRRTDAWKHAMLGHARRAAAMTACIVSQP